MPVGYHRIYTGLKSFMINSHINMIVFAQKIVSVVISQNRMFTQEYF